MKFNPTMPLILTYCLVGTSNYLSAATSIQVSSIGRTELVGSTASIPGGGTTANFSTAALVLGTSFARFQMVRADGSGTRVADLRITPTAVKGTLNTAAASGLMIAQTVNSQGLTDSGTFSILTNFSTADGSGTSSITLRLDWLVPDTNTPFAISAEVTSFDYDFNQFLKVSNTEFSTDQHGSALTRTNSGGFTTWQAGPSNSTFSNPNNAVIFNFLSDSSTTIEVGKTGTGNSLFMFEFRDPSINLIPEPSISLLAIGGLGGLFLRRRRNHRN